MSNIDKTAVIHSSSEVADSAVIDAGAYIGPNCKIGANVLIGRSAYIDCNTTIGDGTRVFANAHLGAAPQDFSYKGEDTKLVIGKDCIIREFSPIHRATTKESGVTKIGDRVFLMTLAHVGHDCDIGDGCIITTGSMLGGHVKMFDHSIIGGGSVVHQFTTIGSYSMIGGGSAVRSDIAPFCLATGDPLNLESLNVVGLRRSNTTPTVRKELKKAFGLLVDRSLTIHELLLELSKLEQSPEIKRFSDFIAHTRRPILRKHKEVSGHDDA